MQIRPHTSQSNQRNRILFNQQFGYYYKNNQSGKQIKVNKLGELHSKFVDNFTGFVNFRQRKNKSLNDKSLMYSQPYLNYNKQQNPIHPKGKKLLGYAQYPFDLRGSLPNFLQEETFKESCQARNTVNPLKKSSRKNNFRYSQNLQTKSKELIVSRKQLKTSQSRRQNFISFNEIIQDNKDQTVRFTLCSTQKQEKKNEKSVIMDASAKYEKLQRIKTENNKSSASLSSSNLSNDLVRSNHPQRTSYFQQSLLNIEKTQTPNFSYDNPSDRMKTSISTDQSSFLYNQASINPKCYKSSCHNLQYIPKRRYLKKQQEDNTVCMNVYKKYLQLECKEIKMVHKLKDSLKIYQPAPPIKDDQHKKNGANDKNKVNPPKGSDKVKK